MLSVEGRQIDCVDSGEGPAVLFLPGSYSTAAAWRQIQKQMEPRWRIVNTSLCGYGETTDSRSEQDFDMKHEVKLVESLAAHIGQPVHLVGHSFGGAVAFAAALSGTVEVASLSFFEANPIGVIRYRNEGARYRDTFALGAAFHAAVTEGELDAPRLIIDFWGREGTYAAMPDPVRAYCREKASVNALDWRTVFAFDVSEADCARLNIPVLLVRGSEANSAMVEMTDALRSALPDSRHAVVDGAGHFLITSHAPACAALLNNFLSDVTQRG